MTRGQAKALMPILQAFVEGKQIQVTKTNDSNWRDVKATNPPFHNEKLSWRIKPEPKLVPFTFEDAHLFRNEWLKRDPTKVNTNTGLISKINTYSSEGVYVMGSFVSYEDLATFWLFAYTGEPCGKLIEE